MASFVLNINGARSFTLKVIQILDVTNQISMLFIYVNTISNTLSLYAVTDISDSIFTRRFIRTTIKANEVCLQVSFKIKKIMCL